MAILPKAIYRFNATIPVKIPAQLFTDLGRTIINFIWKNNNSNNKNKIAKTILYNKRTSGGNAIPDIKLYYRTIVLKTPQYWHTNREAEPWNRSEDPDTPINT